MTINDPIICRCEEVLLSEILSELEQGTRTTKELKIRTRAGMGICQGKTCRPLLEKLASSYNKQTVPASSQLTHNYPIRPVTLKELANTEAK
ncbi:(2Fe-2S)-binding protein [Virgibacillus sp. W0430]|uniref:(2Fe-2S)-binding protein n=1 Tax=Virgibacillus sp. W0430 TaxID=3391580 RepID=UPI003F477A3F